MTRHSTKSSNSRMPVERMGMFPCHELLRCHRHWTSAMWVCTLHSLLPTAGHEIEPCPSMIFHPLTFVFRTPRKWQFWQESVNKKLRYSQAFGLLRLMVACSYLPHRGAYKENNHTAHQLQGKTFICLCKSAPTRQVSDNEIDKRLWEDGSLSFV